MAASSPSPVAVGRGSDRAQRDAASVGEHPAFQPLLATVHRAWPSDLAAAGRLGDAPIHHQVLQFQPEQPVVGAKHRTAQVLGHAGALLQWSESFGLIARLAPETQVVLAFVSGVLSPRAFAHPLTRIRRTARDRQRVATLLQMIDARYRRVAVRVAFGAPVDRSSDVSGVVAACMHQLVAEARTDWTRLPPVPSVATTAA